MCRSEDRIDIDIDKVLNRIDDVLAKNNWILWIMVGMAVAIFIFGSIVIVLGIIHKDWRILTSSTVVTAFLYWPINKLRQIRRDNIKLATVPIIVKGMSAKAAADEIKKMLAGFGR
jgi:hypothetical protein